MNENQTVRLIITTGCPHCQTVLASLTDLVKSGALGRLEIINAAVAPVSGVRSAPSLDLGDGIVLEGGRAPAEIAAWLRRVVDGEAMAEYFHELLLTGRRQRVEDMVRENPARLANLAALLGRADAGMGVRLGIGAVLEELRDSGVTRAMIDPLLQYLVAADPLVRADVCHYLSLIDDPRTPGLLRRCLDDADAGVRDVAADALTEAGLPLADAA